MANIIVLGAGMVGSAIAFDLANQHQVTSADLDRDALEKIAATNHEITTLVLNVTDGPTLQNALQPYDLVVCAVPGFLGFETLRSIIKAGKNVVDISFFPENSLDLHKLAIEYDVTAIVDTGVAPGMDNYILGYWNERLALTHFECLVGGLPKIKKWPFEYKAPFSPIDVIEEYTRPARYVVNGEVITMPALTEVELLDFNHVGQLESFNSDGLRSIIHTMSHIPNMKEKTLRYPGHVEKILVLKEAGFFDEHPMEINGQMIPPLEFTSKLLFNEWKLGEEEEELTVMRVTVRGLDEHGQSKEVVYDLYDEYDASTRTSSMARTTGYTATAAANMFLDGLFSKKGVFPPELVGGDPDCFNYILKYLSDRGVEYIKRESDL